MRRSDRCPTVGNPRRPTLGFDAPVQRDYDGDGMGDECDPWAADTGAGAKADWMVTPGTADHALGRQQRVRDGSHRHQLLLAGARGEIVVETAFVVGQIDYVFVVDIAR